MPAVGLALLAERLCADARAAGAVSVPSQAWALFAPAAVLFAVAMGRPPRLGFATAPPLRAVAGARRASILLLAAGLCAIVAAPLFWIINAATEDAPAGEPANTGAWLLWIAALLLFGAGFALWERQAPAPLEAQRADPPADRLPRRVEWALLAGLLALALALRLPGLETTPPGLWFDEAQNGLVAEQLLAPGATHATFVAENTQMGALPLYFLGLILRVSGHAIWPLRVEPALAGAAIAPLLYLLAARLYGWRVGLAAGALVALSAWNITFSRLGLLSMGTVVFDVLTYVCIAQALRTGRLGYYAGAGVALGLALQMYYVARLAPLLLLALLAHRIVGSRGRIRAPCAVACWCSRWARRSPSYPSACSPFSSRPCSPGE